MVTKGYIRILCLVFFAAIHVLSFAKDKVEFTDPNKTILVKKSGPFFTIALQSNPTTGYSWALKNYDANLIMPVGRKFYAPANNRNMTGAPGYEKWTFQVKSEGFIVPQVTSIDLIYLRPWEGQGARVVSFKVVITNVD